MCSSDLTNKDLVVGIAAGTPIILSEVRRQVEPIAGQARASAKSDAEFFATLERASKETLRSMADRQLVIAEFRADRGRLPASYIDADIEETIAPVALKTIGDWVVAHVRR